MNRRKFTQTTAFAAAAMAIPNINFGKAKEELILGHGKFKYKIVKNWGVENLANNPVADCHEMVQDKNGRLIFCTTETKNNIIILDKKGKLITTWGHEFPGVHGLTIFDANGEEFLFLTDTVKKEVYKTTLDGKVLMTLKYPFESGIYTDPEKMSFIPTETTIAPNGDIYLADGYGSQYITVYNSKGEIKKVFGGYGEENDKFTQCHGILVDTRDKNSPTLLITDRKKHQLKRFSMDGKYISTIQLSNMWNCRPTIKGDNIFMSILKCSSDLDWKDDLIKGCVVVIDKNDKVISSIGTTAPIYTNGVLQPVVQNFDTFQFPHDVCVDSDENLYIPQWNSDKTFPLKLERV